MSVRTVVINADAHWPFTSYVRSFSLDTYRREAGIDYWTMCDAAAQGNDQPFWGYWPLDASRDTSPLKEDLETYLQGLRGGPDERLALVIVIELADLKRLAEGRIAISPAAQSAIDVVSWLFDLLRENTGGAEGAIASERTKLWITFAVRDGGTHVENRAIAEDAIAKAFEHNENARVHTCFFLSESASDERADNAREVHFHKLRVLIDIMRQAGSSEIDQTHDMWRQLREPKRRHRPGRISGANAFRRGLNIVRLVLDRDRPARPWTASDVVRHGLLKWKSRQVESASNIDEQVGELNDSVKALLDIVRLQPRAIDMEAFVQDNQGILDELDHFTKPESIDPDNWPSYGGWLLRHRESRLRELEETRGTFLRDLDRLHSDYMSAVPDLVDAERNRAKSQRDRVTETMRRMETGLANAVKETALDCSGRVRRHRRDFLNAAAEVRELVRDKFIGRPVEELSEDLANNSRLTDFGSHEHFEAAFNSALGRAKRLSMLGQCMTAGLIAIGSFLAMTWLWAMFSLNESWADPDIWWQVLTLQNKRGQLYLAGAMLVASLFAFLLATWWYSREFRKAYGRMQTKASDLAKAVEELPVRAFQYGSVSGQASQLSLIDTQLRDLASMRTATLFNQGFESLIAGSMPNETDMPDEARALRSRLEQDSTEDLSTGPLYARVRNSLARAPIGNTAGAISLRLTSNRNGDRFAVDSANIYADSLCVEPMPEA